MRDTRWLLSRLACVPLVSCLAARLLAAAVPSEEAVLAEGRALREQGKREQALEVLERGLAAFPDSALLHQEAGRTLEGLGRGESAAEHYESALKLRPRLAPALISLGVLRSEAGRLEEAERHLRSAVSLEPDSLAARHNLAVVLERRGDLGGALSEYRRAGEIAPREAKARLGVGSVLEKMGKPDEAAREIEAALSLDPASLAGHYRLSTLCFRLGRRDEGERHLRRFRELKAGEHLARAEERARGKDLRGAIRECQRALDAAEDLVEAHARLGGLYLREGDAARALIHARRAAELDPRPHRLANLSWTLYRSGSRDEALQWIEKAIALEPDRKELQEQRKAILESKPAQ